jgi:hypothetical protein
LVYLYLHAFSRVLNMGVSMFIPLYCQSTDHPPFQLIVLSNRAAFGALLHFNIPL